MTKIDFKIDSFQACIKLIPRDIYQAVITDANMVDRTDLIYLCVYSKITEGKYVGTVLRDNIFLHNPRHPRCVVYSNMRLSGLLRTMGRKELKDTDELLGRRVLIMDPEKWRKE